MRRLFVSLLCVPLAGAGGCSGASAGASQPAAACVLERLSISPADPGSFARFSGRIGDLEIRFVNLREVRNEAEVTVFPEPPLTVIRHAHTAQCQIDGGVWARDSVFVSGNRTVIAVTESSGSNDALIFYRADTCKRLASVDLSNSEWSVLGSEIALGAPGKAKKTAYRLDSQCMPVKAAR